MVSAAAACLELAPKPEPVCVLVLKLHARSLERGIATVRLSPYLGAVVVPSSPALEAAMIH